MKCTIHLKTGFGFWFFTSLLPYECVGYVILQFYLSLSKGEIVVKASRLFHSYSIFYDCFPEGYPSI